MSRDCAAVGQDKFRCRYPAKLWITSHRFSANAHKNPFTEVSPTGSELSADEIVSHQQGTER
jgi:hypothetical protein